jgi:hypothetical protein
MRGKGGEGWSAREEGGRKAYWRKRRKEEEHTIMLSIFWIPSQ